MNFTFVFTEQQVNTILLGLGKLPLDQAYVLFEAIRAGVQEQKAAEAAKHERPEGTPDQSE